MMIRRANEMNVVVNHEMRGGRGDAKLTHVYSGEELKGNSRLCSVITLEPGASIGHHVHDNEEEIYYILKGKGLVMDDGEPVEVNVGDAILTRDGAGHSIENIGDVDLEFMAIINLY
jgi:mannose-6-phosphate isomerase-like protein (cupin superfamily)